MLFRLHNGSLVSLDDQLTDLSTFLKSIVADVQPIHLLNNLIKQSPHKKQRKVFMKIVSELCKGSDESKKLSLDDEPQMSDEELKQFLDRDSKMMVDLREKCKAHSERDLLEPLLEYIHKNVETIFEPLIHTLKFLKDDIFLIMIEFLQIESSKRGVDMFENLPYLMQANHQSSDVKAVVDPALHPYLDFIRKIDDNMLLELSKGACLLGIKPLTVLLGCRLGKFISESSEKTIRQKFHIPSKFRDSVLDKIKTLMKEQNWMKFSAEMKKDSNHEVPHMDIDETE